MLSTRQWLEALQRHYRVASDSRDGLDLLLSVRQFVAFLTSSSYAERYVRELDRKWMTTLERWLCHCKHTREELLLLENEARQSAARIKSTMPHLGQIPQEAARYVFILDKIAEKDWVSHWAHFTDEPNLIFLHLEEPRSTQTGHLASSVFSKMGTLERLVKVLHIEEETAIKLKTQAEEIWRKHYGAERKLKYDWMSSGKHALEQLEIVVNILDGIFYINRQNYQQQKLMSLGPFASLALGYAPLDLRYQIESTIHSCKIKIEDFDKMLAPLIKNYLRQVFEELEMLATSRLSHQHIVEQYKVRCENYDWKEISSLIERYSQEKQGSGNKRLEFEDLLTLNFARYLHDNGYTVHYTPRDGVHEPDILGDDLDPIVVEAKVVGQKYGTKQGEDWIKQGLNAIYAYIQKYYSQYYITDGYLIIFRLSDDKSPMFVFEPSEWRHDQFTIVPKVINIGRINKKEPPVVIRQEDFIPVNHIPD